MRILIVGAGPAGLSFAALMAESNRGHQITLLEEKAPGSLPGFGITLQSDVVSFLGLDSVASMQHLSGRTFRYRGEVVIDLPNPPSGHLVTLSRASLVTALTDRCSKCGVHIQFETNGAGLSQSDLDEFDLVVGADGANSSMRRRYEPGFAPVVEHSENRYGWFGANIPLQKLTIMLNDEICPLLGWGYRYTDSLSTLIVETSEATFHGSGFDRMSPREAGKTIENVFARDLDGASVFAAPAVQWPKFPKICCANLKHRNVVLIGDAAHTTHFSQGFGTMFAFDDSLALQSALTAAMDVTQALDLYEATQRPKIAQFQEISFASMRWSERLIARAESRDQDKIRELIAARWPKNEAPLCPGPRGADRSTQVPLVVPLECSK
jgi:2-polyprenyl-6-methoxyphenol hydroxylase-like FAD-dependent oxidoreductase